MNSSGKETEIKLAVKNVTAMRRRLRALGFRARGGRQREQNTVWDTPSRELAKRGCLLRLRVAGRRCVLTFKGPRQRSRTFKVRPEWEIDAHPATHAHSILRGLGHEPVFRYEKFRTTFFLRGGEALLDETPIGNYLELEGSQAWIRRIARRLGFGPRDFITETYAGLYRAWCRRRRQPLGDMVFRPRRASI